MKHLIIPDGQVKPGVPLEHWTWLGQYIVDKKPDRIICIGDFADMESLSMYDVGKKSFEGRRYRTDVEASHIAMKKLFTPIVEENVRLKRNKEKRYRPDLHLCLGNHEDRISRAVEADPKLEGVLSLFHLWG